MQSCAIASLRFFTLWSNWAGAMGVTYKSTSAKVLGIRPTCVDMRQLVALAPDVILTSGTAGPAALIQATRTIPIVFAHVPDPVGSGFVDTLARPGGNVTGFMQYEYSLSAKWLELLKQIAPNVNRAAVYATPMLCPGIREFAVIQSVASSLGLEVSAINLRDMTRDRAPHCDLRRARAMVAWS